jgi:hypothetical protein
MAKWLHHLSYGARRDGMGVGRQIFESLGVSARRTEPSSTSANTVEEPFVALLEVSKSSAEEALGDVIFIHGLDGDQRGTWTSSDPTRSYWPLMLSEELPRIRVFSLGYKVHYTSWTGNNPAFRVEFSWLDQLHAGASAQRERSGA